MTTHFIFLAMKMSKILLFALISNFLSGINGNGFSGTIGKFVCSCDKNCLFRPLCILEKLNRVKRQNPFTNVAPGSNFNYATQNGLTVPAFQQLLGGSFLGQKVGTNVDLANPSVSAGRGFDAFGVANANQGINRVGDRGQGNYGGGFGRSGSVLGFGAGDNTDVNFNRNNAGLNVNRQRGIPGIFTQNNGISSNPLSGNFFNQNQNTCIGEMFMKGLCFQKGIGVGK